MCRAARTIACVIALLAYSSTISLGQIRLYGASSADWTVLTMAPNGTWGTATEGYVNRAMAVAMARCRKMSSSNLGCGAYMVSIQSGWALGLRCGRESILATGATLAEATAMARRREEELRLHYQPAMADCRRIVSVSAGGIVTEYGPRQLGSDLSVRR